MSWQLAKRALAGAAAMMAVAETCMAVAGFSFADLLAEAGGLWVRVASCVLLYAGLFVLAYVAFIWGSRNGVCVDVAGTDVSVVVGDLFLFDDCLKVIPFNERFDTVVDDVVIAHRSLNGVFLDRYVDDVDALNRLVGSQGPSLLGAPKEAGGRLVYDLGTVKTYGDYALLAFSRFSRCNEAYLSRGDYERCLVNMWQELSRAHAGRRVALPLLGSGITRFDDPSEKDLDGLLRCMLCTLRASGRSFGSGVVIVLTREAAHRMQLFGVRGYVGSWK